MATCWEEATAAQPLQGPCTFPQDPEQRAWKQRLHPAEMRGEAGSVFPAPDTAWVLEDSIPHSASLQATPTSPAILNLLTGFLGGRSCQLSPSTPGTQRAAFDGMGMEKGGEMMNSRQAGLLPIAPS